MPKLITQPEKFAKCVHACGRKDFTLKDVSKHSHMCSVDFVGGNSNSGFTIDVAHLVLYNVMGFFYFYYCTYL